MADKMTYVMALDNALALNLDTETRAKLVALKDSIVKKAQNKKPTATQTENVEIKNLIISVLSDLGVPSTVSEVQKAHADLSALSNQKVSRLMGDMVKAGILAKATDKRKSVFTIVDTE